MGKKNVLQPERVARITALFRTFDYDASGTLSADEFGAVGKALMGQTWTDERSDEIVKSLDKDKNGKIDVHEFVEFFRKNGANTRTDEQFEARQNLYLEAAIRGRAEHFFAAGADLRASEGEGAPESHTVKAEADARALAHENSAKFVHKQQEKLARRGQYARAAQYAAEYASQDRELIRQRRQARAAGNYFAEPEAKLMFVIRIRGMCDMHPKTKKILQLLRLRQIHLGVFLRVNKATQEMIKRVEPYVAYGYPSLKATRELIYKRGFGKKKTTGQAQRVPLTDNHIIDEALGKYGITCFEDLIHEIYTVGPHFKEVNNFLWPFKLNSPKGGLPKKRLGFNEGGQAGNREQYMTGLIARML
jgi:large subunit ribosomal protein L7e